MRRVCPSPTSCRPIHRLWLVLAVGGVLWPSLPALGDTPVPPKEHAERHIYDQETGKWVQVADPVPGTEDGDLDIARQWMAREEYETASKILEAWIKTYGPQSPRYPEALYLKGTACLERGLYRDAHDTYQSLLNDFPGSEYAERALSGDFRVAEQYLAGKRRRAWGGLLRVKDYDGGLEIMDDIVANYSDTPLAEMAQMAKADYYYAAGEFELAEDEYAVFAREYARSRWHARALLMSAQSALASFPGIKFDAAALDEARERFIQFRQEYPAAAEQHQVSVILEQIEVTRADKHRDIAEFYEKTEQPVAARYYYRTILKRWPTSPAASQAKGRLAALGEDFGDIGAEMVEESPDGSE